MTDNTMAAGAARMNIWVFLGWNLIATVPKSLLLIWLEPPRALSAVLAAGAWLAWGGAQLLWAGILGWEGWVGSGLEEKLEQLMVLVVVVVVQSYQSHNIQYSSPWWQL